MTGNGVKHNGKAEAITQAARLLGARGGAVGGKSRSQAKIRAAQRNAKLGGRPRKRRVRDG